MRKFFIILIMIAGLSGCDDFLDTKPYSNTVVENFYKTANDAERALVGCYNALVAAVAQGQWGRGSFNLHIQVMMDAGTDECIASGLGGEETLQSVGYGNYIARDEIFSTVWSFMYKGINRVNVLLSKIDAIPMDAARKKDIIAEARFLRGVFYFYLANFYGGVPLYDTAEQDPMAPRNDLQATWNFILDDLQFAYEALPDRPANVGCAHKWSAAGFLVKSWCYLASCGMNKVGSDINTTEAQKPLLSFDWVNSTDLYKKAYELSEEIIANSEFKLTKYYDRLFRETCATEQYEEALFTAESTDIQGLGNDYLALVFYHIPVGNSVMGGGYGMFRPVVEGFNRYHQLDPRRNHNYSGGVLDKPENRMEINGVGYYDVAKPDPTSMSFCVSKFRYREAATKKIPSALCEGNWPVIRFADILLMNAEATYFYLGDAAKARTRLSQVRERVSADALGAASGAPSLTVLNNTYLRDDFVTELLEERSRELCFEAQRRADLIRFGRIFSTIAGLKDDKIPGEDEEKHVWNAVVPTIQSYWQGAAYRVWFPIALNDVILNKNLVQNPGYESK